MKAFLSSAPFDLALIALLWMGFFGGVAWAANLGLFVVALITVVGVVCVLPYFREVLKTCLSNAHEGKARTPFFKVWDIATDWAIVLLVAAGGHTFLALLLTLGTIGKQVIAKELDDEATNAE